ncbi:GNAT family N-acetyltransferase [Cytobacillus sp. FJAT-54145]|uniref:GNAT family N-acetyltransferase n=1 Tax=Cytobacillus spartinae TaxID=3299023 RepID=A0ABW6KLH5_9BACI
MENGKVQSRKMEFNDLVFLKKLADESPEWKKEELINYQDITSFVESYAQLKGKWRVWEREGETVAISFHLDKAPSNGKPWIGTVLVTKEFRRTDIGRGIIQGICKECKELGNNVVFAGVPIHQSEWMDFLSKCGFEQLKVEKSEDYSYMIMIYPL